MFHRRLEREKKTITAMVGIYCQDRHSCGQQLCRECRELLEYAFARLDHCPFQKNKPTCANCPIHCYKPDRRELMKEVMRYAGPRMLRKYPFQAICHLIDGKRSLPPKV